MASHFERFADPARKVLILASEEAQGFNHRRVGTEHLLLGLLREGNGLAALVLTKMGGRLSDARSTVEWILGRGEGEVIREMGLSPRLKKVIELSVEEARGIDHPFVGTEHLLLGIVREGESIPPGEGKGIAAGVLETLGLRLEAVQDEVLRAMGVDTSDDGNPSGN